MDQLMFQIVDFVLKGIVWSLQQYAKTPQGAKELDEIEAAYTAAGGDSISLDQAIEFGIRGEQGVNGPQGDPGKTGPLVNRAPKKNT